MEAKGGFSRYDAGTLTSNYGLNVSQQMGIPGINVDGDLDSSGLSRIKIAGFTELGDAGFIPLIIANDLWQGLSTLTYITGAHTLKFGVDLKRRAVVAQQSTSARGLFAFNANFTSNAGAAGTGHPFASFLLGYPSSSSRNKYLVKPTYLSLEASSFAQYDWRVRRWMTLNLGVRYDYFSELSEADDQISNVDLASGKIIVAGKDTSSTAGLVGDLNNFAPRIGFAATVVPSTVVRGGYGISYTPPVQGTGGALRNPPFVSLFDITPSAFVPVNRLAEGLPAPAPASTTAPTGALAPIDFNIAMPWVHQFNVAVQRELPGQMAATVAYVGVLGRDLVVSVPVNTPPPGPGAVQARRPLVNVFPTVAGIGYRTNAQTANYRGVQLDTGQTLFGWVGRPSRLHLVAPSGHRAGQSVSVYVHSRGFESVSSDAEQHPIRDGRCRTGYPSSIDGRRELRARSGARSDGSHGLPCQGLADQCHRRDAVRARPSTSPMEPRDRTPAAAIARTRSRSRISRPTSAR